MRIAGRAASRSLAPVAEEVEEVAAEVVVVVVMEAGEPAASSTSRARNSGASPMVKEKSPNIGGQS